VQTDISMRGLWLIYISYLMGSIVLFGWYDRTTVKALLNPTRDRAGNMVFVADGVAVYPFTVAAALVGVPVVRLLRVEKAGGSGRIIAWGIGWEGLGPVTLRAV
jgi:hypothetical protein